MEAGYVLFNLAPGMKKDFLEKIKKVKSVKEAKLVIGIFDAIAKIETESVEELERVYFNEIDKITGIMNSRALHSLSKDKEIKQCTLMHNIAKNSPYIL